MRRLQTFHEKLIPMLVDAIGARTYLELGTGNGETILKVSDSIRRIGVDSRVKLDLTFPSRFIDCTVSAFIYDHAADLGPFDACFIDADHAAASVAEDFNGIWPHISPEGLVFLHDGNPEMEADTVPGYCGNAWAAIKEITRRHEAVTLPFHPGLTIVRKREKWGPR